jgi:hypothetical protein
MQVHSMYTPTYLCSLSYPVGSVYQLITPICMQIIAAPSATPEVTVSALATLQAARSRE